MLTETEALAEQVAARQRLAEWRDSRYEAAQAEGSERLNREWLVAHAARKAAAAESNRQERERWQEKRRRVLEEFPRLNVHLAMRLIEAGITRRNIASVPDTAILAARSVGPSTLRRIRAAYPDIPAPPHEWEAGSPIPLT